MNRQAARELAASTLTALGIFHAVYDAAQRTLGGESPIAIVQSKGTQYVDLTRGTHDQVRHRLNVGIYVRCDLGNEAAAEDQLDSLAETTIDTLAALSDFEVGESDAAAESASLRLVDGVLYRYERIPLTYSEFL